MACCYVDIYKVNETKECKKPLEVLYGKLTCGLHRLDLLELLFFNGVLSKKILKEMEFDSLPEIREFWGDIKDGLSNEPEPVELVLNRLFRLLKPLRPKGWSLVKSNERLILRPSDREVGKFEISKSPSSIKPKYCMRFFSRSLNRWAGSEYFKPNSEDMGVLIRWAIEKLDKERKGNLN